MEVPVVFPNRNPYKEYLRIVKHLSDGKLTVFQVYCSSDQQTYALKLFPKDSYGISQYRKEKLLFKMKHENIIQRIPMICCDERYFAILTEFAKYGDFFDLVTKDFLNSETLIRTYFHQLIAGLEYIHSQGVAHLDLKLENIMLGADFQLKIIDFDQSQLITDKIATSGGTIAYRAPEIINGSCKNLTAADIFSAGIILYAFKAKEFPFVEKIVDNEYKDSRSYLTFAKNNRNFWKRKGCAKKDKLFYGEDFIQLMNGMLHENPQKRWTIKEIKESRWFNGPTLDKLGLLYEMKNKLELIIKKRPVIRKLQIDTKLPLIHDIGKRIDTC